MSNGVRDLKGVFSSGGSEDEETLLDRLLEHSAFQFVAFCLFIAALVAIVTAGFEPGSSGLSSSAVDKPAPYDIRATRDFTFTETNIEASQERRSAAEQSVPPVFDWQEGMAEVFRNRTAKAFSSMREILADEARTYLEKNDPAKLESTSTAAPEELSRKALIEALPPEQRVAFAREHRKSHFREHLKTELADANFDTLARHGFAPAAENALASILGTVMSEAIVENEDLAKTDPNLGIYLRRLRGDKLMIEYHVTDLDQRLVPLRDVPSLVREVSPQGLSSVESESLKSAIVSTAVSLVEPNTTFNKAKTREKQEAARQTVSDSAKHYEFSEGEMIVRRGQKVTQRHYQIIEQMQEDKGYLGRVQIVSGTVFLALLLIVTLFAFGRSYIRQFSPSTKDIFFGATILLLFLLVTQLSTSLSDAVAEQLAVGSPRVWYYLIPVAAGGMLIRLVLNNEHAVIFTLVFSILAGVVADNSLYFAAYTALGTLVGVATVQQVKHRMALMWSGVTVGAVNVAAILAFLLLRGELFQTPGTTVATALIGFGGGLLSGLVVLSILPVFEAVFDYTTDIKLLELANLNHPLLRQLIMRAPGSYHHSMMVGSLCEAAAEAVDANPLLARVGAYYHDIGKAKNPKYFAENQSPGENPHADIKPNMSALIIKNHVKDGLEMARKHGLPRELQDFIAQHHGTSLIAYFYHEAKEMEDPEVPEVDEDDYRYPGPKPQTRETAICLLADGIEAASRAMPDPTPARLKGLVQKMINKAFTDGQLDECDLTLRDLNDIAEALTRILTGIFHQRPEYPDEDEERQERMSQANDTPDAGPEEDEEPAGADESRSFADDVQLPSGEEESEAERRDTTGDDDASPDTDEGDGDEPSGEEEDRGDDSEEGRESLPRLGSR